MFGFKVKFSDDAAEKIKRAAELKGAASAEEFVERIVMAEVGKILQQAGKNAPTQKEVEEIANKMKGLGYLE